MTLPAGQLSQLDADGCLMVQKAIAAETVEALREHAESLLRASAKGRTAGLRNLLREDETLRALATGDEILGLAAAVLGPGARPVRAILFDKHPDANWSVPWHQDLNIAIHGTTDDPAWGPWSTKEGVPHVVPPAAVLEAMITLRLHLDPCGAEQGGLRVVPGSHRHGKLTAAEVDRHVAVGAVRECDAAAGDVLLMRPLLLHSSNRATVDSRRRIVHVEYAAGHLAAGLDWYFDAGL